METGAYILSPPCNWFREDTFPSPEKVAEPATIEYLHPLSDAPNLTLLQSIVPISVSDSIKAYLMLILFHQVGHFNCGSQLIIKSCSPCLENVFLTIDLIIIICIITYLVNHVFDFSFTVRLVACYSRQSTRLNFLILLASLLNTFCALFLVFLFLLKLFNHHSLFSSLEPWFLSAPSLECLMQSTSSPTLNYLLLYLSFILFPECSFLSPHR